VPVRFELTAAAFAKAPFQGAASPRAPPSVWGAMIQ